MTDAKNGHILTRVTDSGPNGATAASNGSNGSPNAYDTPPFLVAAVGASAGGLDAFSRLLQVMPERAPLALVLVQHLARDQQSLLTEILAKRTALSVVEATDEMRIQSGHAYVIPAGKHMTVIDGHLRVRPRPEGSSGVQVDLLFRSLAEFYREKAVGVVLSGGANDGAAGLREIKAMGGITIAQRPDDAQMDSMPRAAIAAGAADVVLPVNEIGAELLRLAALPIFAKGDADETPELAREAKSETDDDEAQYAAIFRLLRRGTGVDFSHYKRPTIARRIARRMALRRAPTLTEYLTILQQDASEVHNLQEDVLIDVTSFFREPDSYLALREHTFPALLHDRQDAPIRIWVPGCSSGEEVYSLAITLFEASEDQGGPVPIQFFGTDVSRSCVEYARAGVYPDSVVSDISPERLRRFFSKVDGGYQIGKAVRERCVFARQDITRDPPFSRLDLIVCRNTLIYLGQPIQRRVLAMMHYALKADGFLMLGRAETTGASADLFSIYDKRSKIYRKKANGARPDFDFRTAPFEARPLGTVDPPSAPVAVRAARPWDLQSEANRLLLDRFVPAGLVVDGAARILSVRGATGPFLELPVGEASLDALKMVRPGLMQGLRSALQEAKVTRGTVRKEGLRGLSESDGYLVDIEVMPLPGADTPHFSVTFERVAAPRLDPRLMPAHTEAGSSAAQETVSELRRELGATRDELNANIHDLAAANEELQSANEEILSSNEELQSTNEELDTAKEELQSTNEELSTLNEELHGRNEELSQANSDLANLLASVQIPIVMIARDLTIRRFTPAAQRLLNLIPSDVGRPIRHIKPNITALDLDKPVAEVIETMNVFEREVEDDEGRAYQLRVRPYQSVDNRVDGAVLALFDISTAKDALSVARRTGDAIAASVREPILLLDSELRVTRANPAFCKEFALRAEDAEGRFVYELGDSQWNIPALRRLLEEVLPERKNFEAFPVEHDFAGLGRRKLLLDGRRIESGRSGVGVILLVIRTEGRGAA